MDLLIDDIRNLFVDAIARNYTAAIELLKNQTWDTVYIDHDLGIDYNTGQISKTGYDVMCWLEVNSEHLPKNIRFVTDNPVGRTRMEQVRNSLY